MRASASGEDGIRAPKVGSEAETCGARGFGVGRGRRIVRGPGQNREITEWYIDGMGSVAGSMVADE